MKLCILDNDLLDPGMAARHGSYGAMLARLLRQAGADWDMALFNTTRQEYPDSFDAYDVVLLTGSKADSFSDEPWVAALRGHISALLARPPGQRKKLLGVCFGHQVIALCLGAPVGRAPQGWGAGLVHYDWHAPGLCDRREFALLASHQDQALALPPGATLLASSPACPVAAYAVGDDVLCVQAHPEFDIGYCRHLLDQDRPHLGEAQYAASLASLDAAPADGSPGHDGLEFARLMVAFAEGRAGTGGKPAR